MNNYMKEQQPMLERRLTFVKGDKALSDENRGAILEFISREPRSLLWGSLLQTTYGAKI